MKNFELEILNGELKGKRFPIKPGGIKLGRSSSNDVAIPDIELSRSHCIFEMYGESVLRVTDLASANGTRVNGKDIGSKSVELNSDDVVEVGDTRIRIVTNRPESPEAKDKPKDRPMEKPGLLLTEQQSKVAEKPKATTKERMRQILWGATVLVLVLAFAVVLMSPSEMGDSGPRRRQSRAEAKPLAEESDAARDGGMEFSYERVNADSKGIFRLAITMEEGNLMRVELDEVGDAPRHINEVKTIKPKSVLVLKDIFREAELDKLDREYLGPESEPPVLKSSVLEYSPRPGERAKRISVVNFPEPRSFKMFGKKLETFANAEMGLTELAYNIDQLMEMARAAALTGATKYEDRDVSDGNLYASIKAYEEALAYLKTVNPKPKEYAIYMDRLEQSRDALEARYKEVIADAVRSKRLGEKEAARDGFRQVMNMLVDRNDERYQQASIELDDIEKRLKKGGR